MLKGQKRAWVQMVGFCIATLFLVSCENAEKPGSDADDKTITVWSHLNPSWLFDELSAYAAISNQSDLQISQHSVSYIKETVLEAGTIVELPDVVFGPSDWIGEFCEAGLLSKTSGLFDQNTVVGAEPWANEYWSVPVTNGNHLMLYYNKYLIASPPVNTAAVMALDPSDLDQGSFWIKSNWADPFYLVPFYNAYGGSPFATDGVTVSVNNQAMINSLNLVKALVDNGYTEVSGYDDMIASFKDGTAAMIICGDWAFNELRSSLGNNLGIARIPEIENFGWPSPYTNAMQFYILKNNDSVELSRIEDVVTHVLDESIQSGLIPNIGYLPVLKTVLADPISDPLFEASADAMSIGTHMPINPEMGIFWSSVGEGLTGFLDGTYVSASSAAAAMQSVADAAQ